MGGNALKNTCFIQLTWQHSIQHHDLNVLPPIATPINRVYRKLDQAHNYITINWLLYL